MKFLTLSKIRQSSSRRLWKYLSIKKEQLFNLGYKYWKKLKTLWQKEKLSAFSKVVCWRGVRKSICGKGLRMLLILQNVCRDEQFGLLNTSEGLFSYGVADLVYFISLRWLNYFKKRKLRYFARYFSGLKRRFYPAYILPVYMMVHHFARSYQLLLL